MKACVLMLAYNQERYVSQAVESVLNQETDFDFELVIGEDCSTDGTRAVLEDLSKAHPGKLRMLLRQENLGMARNFMDTYAACGGDYLAILDADDYWCDTKKLQKQVSLLEANPDAALCFARASIRYEDGTPSKIIPPDSRDEWRVEDLVRESFIPTCTVMYRHKPGSLPAWFDSLALGDWPLHILHALEGKILFLDEVLAIYRVHRDGGWSQLSEQVRLRNELNFYRAILPHLHAPLGSIARTEMLERLWDEAGRARRSGDIELARQFFDEALSAERTGIKLPLRRKMRMKWLLRSR